MSLALVNKELENAFVTGSINLHNDSSTKKNQPNVLYLTSSCFGAQILPVSVKLIFNQFKVQTSH